MFGTPKETKTITNTNHIIIAAALLTLLNFASLDLVQDYGMVPLIAVSACHRLVPAVCGIYDYTIWSCIGPAMARSTTTNSYSVQGYELLPASVDSLCRRIVSNYYGNYDYASLIYLDTDTAQDYGMVPQCADSARHSPVPIYRGNYGHTPVLCFGPVNALDFSANSVSVQEYVMSSTCADSSCHRLVSHYYGNYEHTSLLYSGTDLRCREVVLGNYSILRIDRTNSDFYFRAMWYTLVSRCNYMVQWYNMSCQPICSPSYKRVLIRCYNDGFFMYILCYSPIRVGGPTYTHVPILYCNYGGSNDGCCGCLYYGVTVLVGDGTYLSAIPYIYYRVVFWSSLIRMTFITMGENVILNPNHNEHIGCRKLCVHTYMSTSKVLTLFCYFITCCEHIHVEWYIRNGSSTACTRVRPCTLGPVRAARVLLAGQIRYLLCQNMVWERGGKYVSGLMLSFFFPHIRVGFLVFVWVYPTYVFMLLYSCGWLFLFHNQRRPI